MKSSLKNMVLVLFTITAVSALLVGLVNNITKDVIAETEVKAKNEAKFMVLNTSENEAVVSSDEVTKISDFEVVVSTVVAKNDNNTILGYAVEAPSITKSGYGGRIKLMVGFTEENGSVTISGVEVLSQNETPGLGAEITTPKHQAMYPGKTIYEGDAIVGVTLKKGGADKSNAHEVDAITGGTKTSDGVTAMISDCLNNYKPYFDAARAAVVEEQAVESNTLNE